MAAREPEDALRQQILERMPDFPRLPIIDQATSEALDQSVAPVPRVCGFEQDRAAIRARVRLIKGRDQGFVEEVGEQDSLSSRAYGPRNLMKMTSARRYDGAAGAVRSLPHWRHGGRQSV
jgi:hypothetical protein